MFLVLCAIALSLDPLFCFILVSDEENKCLRLDRKLGIIAATKSLNFLVIFQYVLRVLRICSLLRRVTSISGILAETAWANLFLYMLASHVVGAFWYLFSIERKAACWQESCVNRAGAYPCSLYCVATFGASTVLNDSCSAKTPNVTLFDFGIYFDS
ncbi:putative Ion transport domain-containing protein [Rosa chinensis]|uniref:Putative Ion transport domain-containing protein n=1 Tax=Rosa chinensis TaxID=74649 RepID=A0A2P6SNT5_ROSCH|nr:putative Ion transport domain-containing protein [Rosa chinensis]